MRLTARAPGKVNLCLFLGPVRADGRHELVTLFQSVSLADDVTVEPVPVPAPVPGSGSVPVPGSVPVLGSGSALASAPGDEVVCPDINELNIVTQTLDGLRRRGWAGPPLRVVIRKRVPVAGGMGGGSADAAAMLRLARLLAPIDDAALSSLAASLGADVPSQLRPGLSLGTGAGEVVERIDPPPPHGFVIVAQDFGLSTAEVYREADRLGLPRTQADLASRAREIRAGADSSYTNDLEAAALSLRPEIGRVLDAVHEVGASHAMVSGSGPTVFGLYVGEDAPARAEAAAARLSDRYARATSATPVSEEFAAPRGS